MKDTTMGRSEVASRGGLGRLVLGSLLLLVLGAARADAHEMRPGYLEVRQTGPEIYNVLWKVPARGDLRLRIDPRFPDGCEAATPVSRHSTGTAFVDRWTLRCPAEAGGLVGGTIRIEGLARTYTEVLVRLELSETPAQTARLLPSAPSMVVSPAPVWTEVARTYLLLGIEHILGGIDHLLFILALLMIVRGWRKLAVTITSFTVAHSITLALATLGFVHVPSAPVEATIALSILFLASEIARSRGNRAEGGDPAPAGLTERYPWVVAFTFGLLHGFGFAGALSQIGLPESAIPVALLLFNVGVEVGQLLFVAAVLLALAGLRRLELRWPSWSWALPTYAIGIVAAFWTVKRVAGFW